MKTSCYTHVLMVHNNFSCIQWLYNYWSTDTLRHNVAISFSGITIGFQMNVYDYFEPTVGRALITNVTLVKEDNRLTEQTFGLLLTFGDPGVGLSAATLQQVGQVENFDYVVSLPGDPTLLSIFRPDMNALSIAFSLFSDDLVEDVEGFEITFAPQRGQFPFFALPSDESSPPYSSTLIRIIDTDTG